MNSYLDEPVFLSPNKPGHKLPASEQEGLLGSSVLAEKAPPAESFFSPLLANGYGAVETPYAASEEPNSKPLFLFIEQGPAANQAFQIVQGSCIIGRASIVDLCLKHPSVSRRHAQLKRSGNSLYVRDLGSQNGTYVNQQRIAHEAEVFAGDSIIIGTSLLSLRDSLPFEDRAVEEMPPENGSEQNPRAPSSHAVLLGSLAATFTLLLALVIWKFAFHSPASPMPMEMALAAPPPPMAYSPPPIILLPLPPPPAELPEKIPLQAPGAQQPLQANRSSTRPSRHLGKTSKHPRAPVAKKSSAASRALHEKRRSIDEAFGDF